MRVLTCNIRFSSSGNDMGPRLWTHRRDFCFETILRRDPDVICLQECHNDQLADFITVLGEEYDHFYGNSYASAPPSEVYVRSFLCPFSL